MGARDRLRIGAGGRDDAHLLRRRPVLGRRALVLLPDGLPPLARLRLRGRRARAHWRPELPLQPVGARGGGARASGLLRQRHDLLGRCAEGERGLSAAAAARPHGAVRRPIPLGHRSQRRPVHGSHAELCRLQHRHHASAAHRAAPFRHKPRHGLVARHRACPHHHAGDLPRSASAVNDAPRGLGAHQLRCHGTKLRLRTGTAASRLPCQVQPRCS